MKKILYGFIGLFLVVGLVAGVTYALFNTSASVNGVVLGTATPGLEICFHDDDSVVPILESCSNTLTVPPGEDFGPLVPGGSDYTEFYLVNKSDGLGGDPLDFNISLQVTSAGGDWGLLKDVIEMRLCKSEGSHDCIIGTETPWYTLAEWNTEGRVVKPNPLMQGDDPVKYTVFVRMGTEYDNTYSGKTITDMNWVFTGTQAL